VYVCICNALTDSKLKQAACVIGSIRPGQVYAACGCRLVCGQCVRGVALMLRDLADQTTEPRVAAE